MSCPVCGEDCHCRRPIFPASDWNDLEAFDVSEQQFSASLEAPRFIPEPEPEVASLQVERTAEEQAPIATSDSGPTEPEDHSWRQELAAKLQDYRSRNRGRTPRYPSLQLNFESTEASWSSAPIAKDPFPATRHSAALDHVEAALPAEPAAPCRVQPDTSARILEFPRPTAAWLDELAEPVMERPRILEVPDLEPPPPALGGISIEPIPQGEEGKRLGIEMPMLSAPVW